MEIFQWEDQLDKRCVICLNDGTVGDDQKVSTCPSPSAVHSNMTNQNIEYIDVVRLRMHMHGPFHSGVALFQRLVTIHYNQMPSMGYHCPYCSMVYTQEHPEWDELEEHDPLDQATKSYDKLDDVVQHCRTSTKDSTSSRHEELRESDGWKDKDFFKTTMQFARADDRSVHIKKKSRANRNELLEREPMMKNSIPHETYPEILRGDFDDPSEYGILPEYRQSIEFGPVSECAKAVIPPGLEDEIVVGTVYDTDLFSFDPGEMELGPLLSTLLRQTLAVDKKNEDYSIR